MTWMSDLHGMECASSCEGGAAIYVIVRSLQRILLMVASAIACHSTSALRRIPGGSRI